MKKSRVILFLLVIAVTGKKEDGPLETQNDINKYQINVIFEMFQIFNRRPSQNSPDEWISQRKTLETPSERINLKTIYFSKLVHDAKMEMLNDAEILCNFGDELRIEFKSDSFKIAAEGDIEFLDSGNTTSCRAQFISNYGLNLQSIEIRIANNVTHDYNYDLKLEYNYKGITVNYDKEVCKNISEKQTPSMGEDVLQATKNRLEKRCKLMQIPEYQLMFNKCMQPESNSYILKMEPDSNMAAFPWTHDHNELTIRGLNSFSTLHSILSNDYFFLSYKSAEIRWFVKSTVAKEYDIKIHDLLVSIPGRIDNFINDLNLGVSFGLAFEKTAGYTKILDEQFRGRLETLLTNGLKETYADTICITKKFIDSISKILQPFDKQTFKNSFLDLEIVAQENPLSDTISFIKIETEGFQLENVTCVLKNKNITTLKYQKLSGRLSYLHPVKEKELHIFRISVDVHIKEAIFRILPKRHSEYTNETEIQIYDNFNSTEIAIQITSEFYRLSREERVSIGTKVFNHFVNAIKNKFLHTARSTFLPMVNVCKNSRNSSSEHYSNPSSDPYRYFAIIRDYWVNSIDPFSTQQIDVILNGSWNFKFINLQYVNENIIVDGLRIEDIEGRINIKENDDRNEITTLNYNMSYFSLMINHAEKNIQVRVPPFPNYSLVSAKSNNPLSAQQVADIIEKFQYTVASYIEQSIYSDSEYHAKFRNDMKQIIAKRAEDTAAELDASFKFTTWIAKSLKKWAHEYHSIKNYERKYGILFISGNRMGMDMRAILPVIYEMIYDHSDHSESKTMYFKEKSNTRGTLEISINNWRIRFIISFEIRRTCAMSTLDEEHDSELKLYVDRENIQFQILQKELSNFTLDDVLRNSFAQLTSEYISSYHWHFSSLVLCESSFAALELSHKHVYSINGSIEYSSDDVFMYHITLRGFHNLKSFRYNMTGSSFGFEITVTNLTMHIMWIQNIGGLLSRIPKEMILKIDKIILTGNIDVHVFKIQEQFNLESRQLIFSDRSQLQFSEHENTAKTVEELKKTIAPIVLESLQSSIYQVYRRFDTNIVKKIKIYRQRYLPTR